jgi:hypothetical protein
MVAALSLCTCAADNATHGATEHNGMRLKYDLHHRIQRDNGLRELCGKCNIACRLLVLRQWEHDSRSDPSKFRQSVRTKIMNFEPTNTQPSARQGPDFIIIGTQKSGTTALFNYMITSPRLTWPKWEEDDAFKKRHEVAYDKEFAPPLLPGRWDVQRILCGAHCVQVVIMGQSSSWPVTRTLHSADI